MSRARFGHLFRHVNVFYFTPGTVLGPGKTKAIKTSVGPQSPCILRVGPTGGFMRTDLCEQGGQVERGLKAHGGY